MGQILIVLNGRTYRLACGDGQEERLQSLAAHLKSKVDTLAIQFGQVGEERLLLMAGLLVTDELFDARERIASVPAFEPVNLTPATATPAASGSSGADEDNTRAPLADRQAMARASSPAAPAKFPNKSNSNSSNRKA